MTQNSDMGRQQQPGLAADGEQPQAITLDEAAEIADDVQQLIKAGDATSAWERMRRLHPADIGSIVAGLPSTSRQALVRVMSPETVTWILRQMNPVEAGRVGARLGSHILSSALGQVHPRVAMETLRRLPRMRAREVVEALDAPLEDPHLLSHPPDTAGSLMVSEFPVVGIDADARAARESLRLQGDNRYKFTHVLTVDDAGQPAGEAALADLALAANETPVRSFVLPSVATATVETPDEECARLQRHYNLTQLPVQDGERLVGVILAESLLKATVEEDTRQMLQVASVAGETVDGPLQGSVRARLPWLTVNLATTFLSAVTVALFESTLAQVVVLAAFLPVVAGQGGIGGTQTLTLIVRAMALGELVGVKAVRLLAREASLGLLHGLILGVLVAAVAVVWQQNLALGLVLGLAMFGNMVIAGSVGAGVPLLLKRIGVDPAVASAVIVTTFTDVLGFLLFLGIATAAIGAL